VYFNPTVRLEEIKQICVLPTHGGNRQYTARAAGVFDTALRRLKKYQIVSSQDLSRVIKEKDIDTADVYCYTVALDLGRSLAVDGVLLSSLGEYGMMGKEARFGLNLRMIRVSEGDTAWSLSCSAVGKAGEIDKVAAEGVESLMAALVDHWQTKEEAVAWGIDLPPLTVSSGYSHIDVTIPLCEESEIKTYLVSRSASESGPFHEVKELRSSKGKEVLSFRDKAVEVGRSYLYRYRVATTSGFVSPFSGTTEAGCAAAPPVPMGFVVTGDKVREVELTWEKSPDQDVDGYKIYRSLRADGDYAPIGMVKSRNTTRYADKGDTGNPLSDGTTYFYKITAYYPSGAESAMCQTASTITKGRPSVPTRLRAESDLIREVPLSWASNPEPEIKGYRVYRSESEKEPYQLIGEVQGKTKQAFVDTEGLTDKKSYYYRIAAFNVADVEGDPTPPVCATTRGAPLVPQDLAARDGMVKSVSLEWAPPEDPEVKGYVVYRALSEEGEFTELKKIRGQEDHAYEDKGAPNKRLEDGTLYCYRIRSYNKVDVLSPETETVCARTKPTPQVPQGLKTTSGQPRKVSIKWDANPEKDIKEYVVYRSDRPTEGYKRIEDVPGDQTAFVDDKLADGETYYYQVVAFDADGLKSGSSETVSATTKPAPSSPQGVKADGSKDRIIISWAPNPEADIVEYYIYRKTAGFKKIGSTKNHSYVDEKVKPGRTYSYKITAVDQDGLESPFSPEMPVTIASE
jgi:fibronectin type 3 domain-containing protein